MKNKWIKQFTIWSIEVLIICGALTWISYIIPSKVSTILGRFLEISIIYQVIIFVTKDFDARKDSLVAGKNILNLLLLYIESPNGYTKRVLDSYIENMNLSITMIHKDVKDTIDELIENYLNNMAYDTVDIIKIKTTITDIEHNIQIKDFSWNDSLLLRLLK